MTPARRPEPPATTESGVVALAAAALAGAGLVVWAGASAALLVVGHPRLLRPADVATALTKLPARAADPRTAWPERIANVLPGPGVYWAAHVVVVAAVVAAAAVVFRRWRRGTRGHPLRVRAYAGTARAGELGDLRTRQPEPGRLTLGTHAGRLLSAEPGASLAVVGPTGCGKTAGFAIPALLEWRGPVIATSVKADLLTATLAHRRSRGTVWVYDPTGTTAAAPALWSPLDACATWPGAMRTAAWIAEAAAPRRGHGADDDYWYAQARRALAPYLFAAAVDGASLADLVAWVDDVDNHKKRVEKIVDAHTKQDPPLDAEDLDPADRVGRPGVPGAEQAAAIFQGLWKKEPRVLSSVLSTMENVLAPYADVGVAAAGAKPANKARAGELGGGIDFAQWLSGDNTIYVVATAHEQDRLRPVLTVLAQQAIRAAYDTAAAARSGALAHPLLVLLDEAANIAPLPDLPGYAATARSHGITLVTIWQDLAQIHDLYGQRAQTVLNNHRAKLFGSGIADLPTLEYLSKLVGEHRHLEHNRTSDAGGGSRRTVSEQTSIRPLAPVDVLRRLNPDDAVLLYGHQLPARVRLRPYYRDPRLRALSETGGAQ
jgi:type IV secretion system protein VirD4